MTLGETLSGERFAEKLPKNAEFARAGKMAISAAELATTTKEQLDAEVAAKNTELEQQGVISSHVQLETTEEFFESESGKLLYDFYGVAGTLDLRTIDGQFEGLTVVDTAGVIVRNKMGMKVRGIEPERFVVCATIDTPASDTQEGGRSWIPLRGIETPLLPRETWDHLANAALG